MQAELFYGTVLDNGTVRLRGQVCNDDGDLLSASGVDDASYTIYLQDEDDPDGRTAVAGHSAVSLTPSACILDDPGDWSLDSTGYNFQHIIDISTYPAFTMVGRTYVVAVSVTPTDEQPRLGAFSIRVV